MASPEFSGPRNFHVRIYEFKFPWTLVNGADDRQPRHSTVIKKALILDTVLFIVFLFSCMFMCTSELSLMPADTCKFTLAATIGCAMTSGCLFVVYSASPEGQNPRNIGYSFSSHNARLTSAGWRAACGTLQGA